MKYQIEELPAFRAAGFNHRVKTEQAFEIVPGIWDGARKDGTMNRIMEIFKTADYRPSGFLGVAVGGRWGDSDEMDYFIGATTYVDGSGRAHAPAPEGMEEIEIKPAKWVIISADGKLPDAVQNINREFYSEWLPSSGYQLDDLPVIESYMRDDRQEVWIAVKEG